jgi:hypothetical protein
LVIDINGALSNDFTYPNFTTESGSGTADSDSESWGLGSDVNNVKEITNEEVSIY